MKNEHQENNNAYLFYCRFKHVHTSQSRKWATAKLVEKNKQLRLAAAKKTIEELENKEQG